MFSKQSPALGGGLGGGSGGGLGRPGGQPLPAEVDTQETCLDASPAPAAAAQRMYHHHSSGGGAAHAVPVLPGTVRDRVQQLEGKPPLPPPHHQQPQPYQPRQQQHPPPYPQQQQRPHAQPAAGAAPYPPQQNPPYPPYPPRHGAGSHQAPVYPSTNAFAPAAAPAAPIVDNDDDILSFLK